MCDIQPAPPPTDQPTLHTFPLTRVARCCARACCSASRFCSAFCFCLFSCAVCSAGSHWLVRDWWVWCGAAGAAAVATLAAALLVPAAPAPELLPAAACCCVRRRWSNVSSRCFRASLSVVLSGVTLPAAAVQISGQLR